jgi:hypothetical protein
MSGEHESKSRVLRDCPGRQDSSSGASILLARALTSLVPPLVLSSNQLQRTHWSFSFTACSAEKLRGGESEDRMALVAFLCGEPTWAGTGNSGRRPARRKWPISASSTSGRHDLSGRRDPSRSARASLSRTRQPIRTPSSPRKCSASPERSGAGARSRRPARSWLPN